MQAGRTVLPPLLPRPYKQTLRHSPPRVNTEIQLVALLLNGTFVATGFCCYNVEVLHDLLVHEVRKNIFHKRKLSLRLFSFEQNIILF
jgi:hypothetical protein